MSSLTKSKKASAGGITVAVLALMTIFEAMSSSQASELQSTFMLVIASLITLLTVVYMITQAIAERSPSYIQPELRELMSEENLAAIIKSATTIATNEEVLDTGEELVKKIRRLVIESK